MVDLEDPLQAEKNRESLDEITQFLKRELHDPVQKISEHAPASYRRVLETKQELIWKKLEYVTVEEAKEEWLSTVQNPCTKKSYQTAMDELMERFFLIPSWSEI
jgi:predicted CoA-binding protein